MPDSIKPSYQEGNGRPHHIQDSAIPVSITYKCALADNIVWQRDLTFDAIPLGTVLCLSFWELFNYF